MNNFTPGGMRNRRPDLGGRPKSDADYRPNKKFDNKPRFDNRDKRDVVLHKTNCTTCGKPCEVPFRPDGAKPVLCNDCFAAKNASPTNMSMNRERFTPNERIGHKSARPYEQAAPAARPNIELVAVTKQLAALEDKVSQILELLKTTPKAAVKETSAAKEVVEVTDTAESAEPKKVRKPKKATVAKKVAKKAAKKAVAKKAKKK